METRRQNSASILLIGGVVMVTCCLLLAVEAVTTDVAATQLLTKYSCAACQTVDKKLVEPAYYQSNRNSRRRRDYVLIDLRTYLVKPGKLPHELELYAKHGLEPQTRHLGPPVAYLHSESGRLNTLVHLWAFENADDREQRRAAMMADPEWQSYLQLAAEAAYLVDQRNTLMVPASFAPIKR